MTLLLAVLGFVAGVVIVVISTERLLDALVGLARAARIAPFVAAAILSGLGGRRTSRSEWRRAAAAPPDVALGTAFGGAIFLLCIALGLGALIAPLRVHLPRGVVLLMPAAAIVAGLPILFPRTPRWTGAVLLVAFAVAIAYLIVASRDHEFLSPEEGEEGEGRRRSVLSLGVNTVVGIAAITLGGELVAYGAETMIRVGGVSAGLIGVVVTPAAIEAEEVIRQVIPARRGRPDVSAGNAIGTVIYFLLFNLGLIALLTPVAVPSYVRVLDWPVLVGSSALGAACLIRGKLGRPEGALLVSIGVTFAVLQALR